VTESLAELLRSLRSTARLSQESLAELSGLSTRTISDIETGAARTPRLITVMLLAEALGLSPADRSRLQDAARKPSARPDGGGLAMPAAAALRAAALVGRDADVARLCALLARDGVRLVTLVGPAGVGKTSLAIRVAVDRADAFDRGVVVAELAAIDEPELVPAAVARALGIRESADTPASEAVHAHLRERSALLVLDNLEHLTPVAPWVGSLLAACPHLAVLGTSREPLHLRSEHVYAVRPLEIEAAVTLFVQRAQMAKPEFELTAANAAAVETIVDHLEGLPLAIELAAPRLLLLPPKALAARLERRLPLLGDGAVDRPERQQTMHGAIAWSYDLLAEDEQRLFRRLAVLQGGGNLEAAAAVLGDEGDERSILFRLAPLVDKNMLLLVEDADAEPRVSMLEMLREYAQERLAESGEFSDAQRRHAEYVLRFAQGAERELSGAAQGRSLARFEVEHGNIRSALQWLARTEETAFGFQLVAAVWRFWWLHGHLTEGLSWVRRFLQLRTDSPAVVPDALYGKVLRANVVLLSALGNFDEAFASCEQAIALQREIVDDAGLGASLTSLGIILQFRGEYDRADDAHAESLAIRKRLGDDVGVATSLSNLASIAFSKNDLARAATLGDESVAIYRRIGHESGLAHALMKIGLVAAAERNYERAEELFNECLRMQRAIGNTGSMYYSLENLGAVAHRRGNYRLALERYHEALDLLDSMPNKSALAKTLEDLAATIAAVGDPSRGARLFGAADALRRFIGSPLFPSERADFEAELAVVRAMLGNEAFDVQWRIGASITLERALDEARETRPPLAAAVLPVADA
jgi:predicted ATPase/transcriptional regulator with XRE-family HTH domain